MTKESVIRFRTDDETNRILEMEANYTGTTKSDLVNQIILGWKHRTKNKSEIDEIISKKIEEMANEYIDRIKSEIIKDLEQKTEQRLNMMVKSNNNSVIKAIYEEVIGDIDNKYVTKEEVTDLISNFEIKYKRDKTEIDIKKPSITIDSTKKNETYDELKGKEDLNRRLDKIFKLNDEK
ncbi:MAG: hypothetical protein PHP08_00525 [Candidatus Dojkabacteria bacterium]|nr:hypothetical protein [Candidatus Dojkabacteria bacterium]